MRHNFLASRFEFLRLTTPLSRILCILSQLTFAICFTPFTVCADVIVDNGSAGTSFTGTWRVSGGVDPFGTNALYSSLNGNTYTFKTNLASGEYQVYAWWTHHENRRTSVPYAIQHLAGTATVSVNQQIHGGQWNLLGTWNFGTVATVTLRSLGNGTTCADAVMMVPTDSSATPVFPGSSWAIATPESQGIDSLLLSNAIDYLESLPAADGSTELVIVRNGYVVWQGANVDNRHGVWSLTKSFVSILFGLLVDDQEVSLETFARDFDADLSLRYPTVTMRHFLTQTSGYRAIGDEPDGDYVHGPSDTPFDPDVPLFTPPGSQFAYWDSALNELGLIVTKMAGKSMQAFFQERIGSIIGLKSNAWDWGDFGQVDGLTVNGGAGNHGNHVFISAIELARFGHLILNKGYWNGAQPISSNWIDAVTDVQVDLDIPWAAIGPDRLDGRGAYGFLWWVNGITPNGNPKWPGATPRTFAASGFNNNKLFIVPERNMVIVRLGLDEEGGATRIQDAEWGQFLSLVEQAVAENKPPVVLNDNYSTGAGTPLDVSAPGVLSNDTDADGDLLTAVLVSNVSHGSLALYRNGGFGYTPQAGFTGTDSFTYRANDGTVNGKVATVTIAVTAASPINTAPVSKGDNYTTGGGTGLSVSAPGVLGNDTDADGDLLTAVLVSNVRQGSLTLRGDGGFGYTPRAGFTGADSFTYRANDGTVNGNVATVTITVTAVGVIVESFTLVNADTDQDILTLRDGDTINLRTLPTRNLNIRANTNPAEIGSVKFELNGSTYRIESGAPYALAGDSPSGNYLPWTPAIGQHTLTAIPYTGVRAGGNVGVKLTVHFTVVEQSIVNKAPVSNGDNYATGGGTGLSVSAPGVLGNDTDADGDLLTAVLVSNVRQGSLTLRGDGGFGYTPRAGFTGADSFTYRANDGTVNGNLATVTIAVTAGGVIVESFTLINADTDQDILTLRDGDTINLRSLPTRNLNIRANTNPAEIGSVKFELNGSTFRVESGAPYALAGDSPSGNYLPWTPAIGQYTLTATPYTGVRASGNVGVKLTAHFTVVEM